MKKREIGRARSRDCSRLINACVSLTSAGQKSSVARSLPIESPRHGGESVRENNFLLAGYTLSHLLLSNDSLAVPEREEKTRVCKSPRAVSCDFRESYPCDSPPRRAAPRREVSVYVPIACGHVLCRLLNMIMSADRRCKMRVRQKTPAVNSFIVYSIVIYARF